MPYAFGPFELNARERLLTREGEIIHLQPKSFDVLRYLLEHAGHLVEKHEVLDAVWEETIVTENSLTACIRQIRIALHDHAGDHVRITAQLIDVSDGTHIWSDTYDRTMTDIFAVQDDVAAAIIKALQIHVGVVPARVRPIDDPDAYALYLQARFLNNLNTLESREQAIDLYRQALAIAPGYTDAWSDLGVAYRRTGQPQLGRKAIEHALTLDPNHAASLARASWLAERREGDIAEAARLMRHALELDVNDVTVLHNSASLLWTLGRGDKAIPILEYLMALDPLDPNVHTTLGFAYRAKERFDEAMASFHTALRLSPDKLHDHLGLGWVLLSTGEFAAALAAMQQELYESHRMTGLVMAYHALGQAAESDAALEGLIEKYEKSAPYNIALALTYRGEVDRAFEWFERAVEYKDTLLGAIINEPFFTKLHSDPRWLPFLERIGRSPEQLAAIDFEVKLPE